MSGIRIENMFGRKQKRSDLMNAITMRLTHTTPSFTTSRLLRLLGFVTLVVSGRSFAFNLSPNVASASSGRRTTMTSHHTSSSSLTMIPKKLISSLLEQQHQPSSHPYGSPVIGKLAFSTLFLGSATAPVMDSTTTATTTIVSSSSMTTSLDAAAVQEAHLLADLSHVGLDLATFLFAGTGVWVLRVVTVLGRLCAMAADYLPDHTIFPDELIYQVIMLSVSCFALCQTAWSSTIALTSNADISYQDSKAYAALFRPAGTTWQQFKALITMQTIDWLTLQSGDIISTAASHHTDEYIYWLYSGDIVVNETYSGQTVSSESIPASRRREDAGRGLVGDRHLLRRLGRSSKSNKLEMMLMTNVSTIENKSKDTNIKNRNDLTIQALSPNTKLLRINTSSLHLLMDNDERLADSIRTMLFASLEAKLNAQQQVKQQLQQQHLALNGTAL